MRALSERLSTLRHRDFARIWMSGAVSGIGDWIGVLALTLLILERTGSAAWAGAVVTALTVPAVGPGQLLTGWLERHATRLQVLVASDLARAVVLVAAALVDLPPWAILVVAGLLGLASAPFDAIRAAVTPETVPDDRYGPAVALTNMTYQLTVLVGYMAGGALVAGVGFRGALLLDAATYLVSAGLLARLSVGRDRRAPDAKPLRAALAAVWTTPTLRWAMLLVGGSVLLRGVSALAPAVAVQRLGSGASGAGLLAALAGAGSLVASAVVPATGTSRRLLRIGAAVTVAAACGAVVGMAVPGSGGAGAAMVASGIGLAAAVPLSTVFGADLAAEHRAAGFALAFGVLRAVTSAAPALSGAVADVAGFAWASAAVAVPALLLAAAGLTVWSGRTGRQP